LFYGDAIGSPGTELSFFEMPMAGQTHRGTNAITRIGLIVPTKESLQFWQEHLRKNDLEIGEITSYAGKPALHFTDEDGLELVLQVAEKPAAYKWHPWKESPIPEEHQIRGIGTVESNVRRPERVKHTLTDLFHYEKKATANEGEVYQTQPGAACSEILVLEKEGERERPGRGSTHHLAIRVKDTSELKYWEAEVKKRGFHATEIVDRHYFHSLYFRESNGILFELATDGPGFLVDSPEDRLGKQLDLP